jgi:hypothetical protein
VGYQRDPLDISSDPVQLEAIRRASQNFRPYPQFGNVLHYSNFGHSSFHSGTVKLEKRMSSGLSFTSFYTWGKSIDEASDDGTATGVTYYNRRLDKARSNYDVATVDYHAFGICRSAKGKVHDQ